MHNSTKKRKIYLASRYENRFRLRPFHEYLKAIGHTLTSTWIFRDEPTPAATAQKDLDAIDEADTIVVWVDPVGRGHFVEYGYAIAKGLDVFVVSKNKSECIFLQLQRPQITYVDDWGAMLDILEK